MPFDTLGKFYHFYFLYFSLFDWFVSTTTEAVRTHTKHVRFVN